MNLNNTLPRIGILGGGQLGRMLQWEAQRMNWDVWCMDESLGSPALIFKSNFVLGDIRNYNDVVAFGIDKDIVTIEIEHVNLEALITLEKAGVKVHPNPNALSIIKEKNKQKLFYSEFGLNTSPFLTFNNKEEALQILEIEKLAFPLIYKTSEMGYDGKGVKKIDQMDDALELPDVPGLFEHFIDIDQEIAIMVARNENGECKVFPAVDMFFHIENHILDRVECPSALPSQIIEKCKEMSLSIINKLDICGVLAVEFLIDKSGEIYINEVAPRPHNSMHLTIDNNMTSQFEQHLRGISNFPLGNVDLFHPSIMVNLLGKNGYEGPLNYSGWAEVLSISGLKIHLYGKNTSKPHRKVGHVTITGYEKALLQAQWSIFNSKFLQDG